MLSPLEKQIIDTKETKSVRNIIKDQAEKDKNL